MSVHLRYDLEHEVRQQPLVFYPRRVRQLPPSAYRGFMAGQSPADAARIFYANERQYLMSTYEYDSGHQTGISPSITNDELRSRISELRGYERLTQRQSADLRDYEHHLRERERERLHGMVARMKDDPEFAARATERVQQVAAPPSQGPVSPEGYRIEGTNPNARTRDIARRVIDEAHRSNALPAYAAERAERLVSDGPQFSQNLAARWAIATGDPAYRAAFAKKLADPDNARDLWTEGEFRAWQKVMSLQSEQRAMGLTGADGGFMVPLSLDPSILLTSDGSTNPLRQIARVEQIATNEWHGVSSAGATAEWKAEGVEAADGSPTLAEPIIPVHFGDSNVPFSYEVGMDAENFLTELQGVLNDAADQLQAAAFMNGSGSGEPTGLVTALPAGSKVAAGTADAVDADDVVGLQNALPPRFQAGAQWAANLATINAVGSLETANGSLRFPEVGAGSLLRKRLHEASHLETAGGTASAGNDNVLLYGDFKQFVIVDRIGTQLEILPKFGANGRPTGQRQAFLWFRTGSDVVVPEAFRLLTA